MADSRERARFSGFGAGLLAAGIVAALTLACGSDPAPDAGWPAGALVIARRGALDRTLAALGELGDSPLARRAARVRDALPRCPLVSGHDPDGDLLRALEQLRCARAGGPLAGIDALRGERDAAFAWPLAKDARAIATLDVADDGGLDLALRLPRDVFDDARRLLLPGAEPAGPEVLRGEGSLLHARVRPAGGIDVASLVAAGGQADRLFRLKSALFAGVVLDGSWEVAVYPPGEGAWMPRAALAVGFAQREAAVSAMEGFLSELRAAWPVARSDFALGAAEGACLQQLRILPEFLPCYVATDAALVVGWNPESLRAALAAGGHAGSATSSRLVVDFERVAEADARLARRSPAEDPQPRRYPWRRLVAEGAREPDGVRLRVRVEGGSQA